MGLQGSKWDFQLKNHARKYLKIQVDGVLNNRGNKNLYKGMYI